MGYGSNAKSPWASVGLHRCMQSTSDASSVRGHIMSTLGGVKRKGIVLGTDCDKVAGCVEINRVSFFGGIAEQRCAAVMHFAEAG